MAGQVRGFKLAPIFANLVYLIREFVYRFAQILRFLETQLSCRAI
jgi:hypothetical protein